MRRVQVGLAASRATLPPGGPCSSSGSAGSRPLCLSAAAARAAGTCRGPSVAGRPSARPASQTGSAFAARPRAPASSTSEGPTRLRSLKRGAEKWDQHLRGGPPEPRPETPLGVGRTSVPTAPFPAGRQTSPPKSTSGGAHFGPWSLGPFCPSSSTLDNTFPELPPSPPPTLAMNL